MGVVLTVLIVFFSVGIVYQNIPRTPVKMMAEGIESREFSMISYGETPVFLENLRFNHDNVSYFIGDSCFGVRRGAMVEAFGLFELMPTNLTPLGAKFSAVLRVTSSEPVT